MRLPPDALVATPPEPAAPAAARDAFLSYRDAFRRAAAEGADRVAIVAADGCLTYGELARQVASRARALRRLAGDGEPVVAICLDRSAALVVSLLAALEAGVAFLPLDPQFPAARLRTIVTRARARLVVTEHRHAALFDETDVPLLRVDGHVHRGGDDDVVGNVSDVGDLGDALDIDVEPPFVHIEPASLAYVIYTSGSTGEPKGVAVSQESFVRYITWAAEAYACDRDTAAIVHTSVGFDLSLTSIFMPLLRGMRLVLVPEADGIAGALRLLDDGLERIGLLKLTPSHLRLMLDARPADRPARWQADVLIVGGEQLSMQAVRGWMARSPATRLFNEYGPTEATVGCCVARVLPDERGVDGAAPIGTAIAGARLRLVAMAGAAAQGATEAVSDGELLIGGPCLARGYLHAPGATALRFVPDADPKPDRTGARLYRTGDRVRRIDGGDLAYVGRTDRQRKIDGVRIEPAEIEAVLGQVPGVRAAAVTGVSDGDGRESLMAVLAVHPDDRAGIDMATLTQAVAAHLPRAALPRAFYLVERLPVTAGGKVDYDGLVRDRQLYARVPDPFLPPRNPMEERLASMWRTLLDRDEIGIDESFFTLDGNSMKSIAFIYEAKKQGLSLSTRDLFELQTIRRLAARLTASPARTDDAESTARTAGAFALIDRRDRERMPAGIIDAYPLALLQAGTLFESDQRTGSGTYHNVNSYHVACVFDEAAFRESLVHVMRRHPILRTAYDFVSFREPLQLVHETTAIPLDVIDLRALPDDAQRTAIDRFIEDESRTAFERTQPPLLRFFIHRRADERLQFTLSKHHSILDGWSAATLITEIIQNYGAIRQGRPAPFQSALDPTFRHYVGLERQALASDASRAFWSDRLREASYHALRPWGGTRPQPDCAHSSIATRPIAIGAEVSARLKEAARLAQVPLKSVLLALHLRLVTRLVGDTRLVTGVVSHGRPETTDADKAVGLFINTLPFHLAIEERDTWLDLARRLFQEEVRVFPHRRYAMARIKKDVGWDRLFDTIFYFTNFHVFREFRSSETLRFIDSAGFEETEVPFTSAFSLHPLTSEISLVLRFHVDHFSDRQIAQTMTAFTQTLASLAAAPEARVLDAPGVLDVLDVTDPSDAADAAEVGRTHAVRRVSELIAEQAKLRPDAIALRAGARTWTYAGLCRQTAAAAGRLTRLGVRGDDVVALCLAAPAETIAAMIAVNQAGGAFLALDPDWPDARLAAVLTQAAPRVLLVAPALVARFETHGWRRTQPFSAKPLRIAQVPNGQATIEDESSADVSEAVVMTTAGAPATFAGDAAEAGDARDDGAAAPIDPDHLAYIMFTSGSTGTPKGVMVTHRNLFLSTRARPLYYGAPYERFLLLSRLTFDSSYAGVWGTLCGGGTLELLDEDRTMDVGRVAALVEERSITHLLAIPSLYRLLLPELPGAAYTTLQVVMLAGEALPRDLQAAHAEHLPTVALHNEYGPTEATVWATAADVGNVGVAPDSVSVGQEAAPASTSSAEAASVSASVSVSVSAADGASLPIGRALPHVGAWLFDRTMRPVLPGVVGELYLGGAAIARGYRGAPALTAQRFVPNPLQGAHGASPLYRTGDLVRLLPDGQLQFVGRSDNQVKVRGVRVELEEIEQAVHACFAVDAVMAGVRADASGRPRLLLWHAAEPGAPALPDLRTLRLTLAQRLPAYALPDELVPVERLPRLSNHKLDRRAAATLPIAPPGRAGAESAPAADAAPANEIERALAGLWCEALGLPAVETRRSFFEVGGDSLLANQVVLRTEKLFGAKLQLKEFYRDPTIAGHARLIQQRGEALRIDCERVAALWNRLA